MLIYLQIDIVEALDAWPKSVHNERVRKKVHVNAHHRLSDAQWRPSKHWDERPAWAMPEAVVVHCVSLPEGQFGTGHPQALFCGELDCALHPDFADLQDLQVAPHVFIDRQGSVCQFVSFDKRAWHAGESSWRGRSGCNEFTIGIELEGSVHSRYTLEQYDALVAVARAILARYSSIGMDSFIGHNEVAPGRKLDPGPYFDWCGFLSALHQNNS